MKKTCVVHFFCFRSEKPFLGKSSQKNRNCQFKLTFGTKTNSNMQNSIVIFTFLFQIGITLFGQIGPKNQNYQFELKFRTRPI